MKQSYLVATLLIVAVGVSLALIATVPRDGGPEVASHTTGAVALVYIEGIIQGGRGSAAMGGSTSADVICDLLRQAGADPRIRAVVLRLNSPGGSAAGSHEIASTVLRLRAEGTPVVASMADIAASGAYWIAVAADEIVADPATITGSIGVIMEIHNIEELYDKLGINVETLKTGEFKDMGSSTRPLAESERRLFQAMLDDVHDQFVRAVAEHRGLTVGEVRFFADGRVFTGRQALATGLVDTLGGLDAALDRAAALAGLSRYEVLDITREPWWSRWLGLWADTRDLGAWDSLRRLLSVPGISDGKWRLVP